MSLRWDAAGGSHVGRVRSGNEDALRMHSTSGLFLVADGMGGHAAGEVASAIAADTVEAALLGVPRPWEPGAVEAALVEGFRQAHRAIVERAARDPATRGMGTTLTACAVDEAGRLRVGHIGDSRAYLLRGARLTQVTRDHTWVQDQVDAGLLAPSGARTHRLAHVITRALGADSTDEPDLVQGQVEAGDLLLLCTDGLTGMLPDSALRAALRADRPVEELVAGLIDAANERGGTDNVTAIVVRVLPA